MHTKVRMLHCPDHPDIPVYPKPMHKLFLPGCSFDMKVMIAVGLLRWTLCLQREEIRILLKGRGIKISTGEISYLSERFLAYFCLLHRSKYPEIARLFESMGGAVLHIDGTEEKGSRVVFCAKEGRTGITVMADTIPSESMEHVTGFLERYKEEFGPPLVVVRDMSQTLEKCATEVFLGVPQQICHYHFVKNLGKEVLRDLHSDLRRKVINTKMVPRLTELKKTLRQEGRNAMETAELLWVRLAIEHLEYARDHSGGFPFKLGYHELVERAKDVHRLARRLMLVNSQRNMFVEELMVMDAHIKRALDDEGVKADARRLKFLAAWFEKVREALRLSRPRNPLKEGESMGSEEMDAVERELRGVLDEIEVEARRLEGDYPKIASKMRKMVAEHRHELFVHVKDSKGRDVAFSRDNNFLERSYRWGRMHCRRRTGRSMTRREMDVHGALNAIFSNLFNELYVTEILGDVNDLGMAFQQIGYGEVREFLKELQRLRRGQFLPVKDSDRGELLESLVETLECGDASHARINEWVAALS
jgi:hypothetical protein